MTTCGHVPFPGNGAYGHWTCSLPRHHLGSHRFNNYTTPRIPRVWAVKTLLRYWRAHREWASHSWTQGKRSPLRYRDVLHRAKYRPIGRQS
jgi:hypothetical protein